MVRTGTCPASSRNSMLIGIPPPYPTVRKKFAYKDGEKRSQIQTRKYASVAAPPSHQIALRLTMASVNTKPNRAPPIAACFASILFFGCVQRSFKKDTSIKAKAAINAETTMATTKICHAGWRDKRSKTVLNLCDGDACAGLPRPISGENQASGNSSDHTTDRTKSSDSRNTRAPVSKRRKLPSATVALR